MISYTKGKYFNYDLAEYIFWYCENKLDKPINHYQMQYMLIYMGAIYLNKYNEYLIYQDYDLECWNYGFLFSDIFFNPNYMNGDSCFNNVKGVKYPNEHIYNEISYKDKNFINDMCKILINKKLNEFQHEMQNMNAYKNNFLPLYNDENGCSVAQIVTIDEISKDLIKEGE